MSATQKFIRYAFGLTGTRVAVPDGTQVDGTVSYEAGYGIDYQRQKTDPLAKNIERDKMNQLFYDLSLGLRQYQLNGTPEFIPAADNGGAAIAYAKGARVVYTDGRTYRSRVAGNVALPSDLTQWDILQAPGNMRYATSYAVSTLLTDADTGKLVSAGANGITLSLPQGSALDVGAILILYGNGFTGVTVARQGADTIIPGSGGGITSFALGQYDTAYLLWSGTAWYNLFGEAHLAKSSSFAATLATPGYQKLPGGFILQWAQATTVAGGHATGSWPLAFPSALLASWCVQAGWGVAPSSYAGNGNALSATNYDTWVSAGTSGQTVMVFGLGV